MARPKVSGGGKPKKTYPDAKWLRLDDYILEGMKPIPYIVEDMLPVGGTSLLAGVPKVGKSVLARNLIRAIADFDEDSWLDRMVKHGPVLYLPLEEMPHWVGDHFTRMGAGGKDLPVHIVHEAKFYESYAANLDLLDKKMSKIKPALVVIDPLFMFMLTEDSNNYAEVMPHLQHIRELAETHESHICMVHHNRKSANGTGHGTEVLGSVAIVGSTDANILINWENDDRVLYTSQRQGVPIDKSYVEMDYETGVVTLSSLDTRAPAAVQRLVDTVAAADDSFTIKDLAIKMKMPRNDVDRHVKKAIELGMMEHTDGKGTPGSPRQYGLVPMLEE